jgi:TetR/AcrR family transcriptional regulator, transcriptional repressor of aconitase
VARTVDPERHAARRLHIIDAALTCFAADGYAGATTGAICRQAGIGSGTFFHYFPTKAAVLLAILELGTAETRDWFGAQRGRTDAYAVIMEWVHYSAAQSMEPRLAGFVRAVGAVMTEPNVAAALAADEQAQRDGLLPWVRRAQSAGHVRTDLTAPDLTAWVMLVLDGFLGRLAADPGFTAQGQSRWLIDAVERLLEER